MLEHSGNTLKTLSEHEVCPAPILPAPECLHVKFTSLSLPQGPRTQEPGRGRDRNCERERERVRGEKRFQDISSLRLEGVSEMRRGGGVGGMQRQGQDSQVEIWLPV